MNTNRFGRPVRTEHSRSRWSRRRLHLAATRDDIDRRLRGSARRSADSARRAHDERTTAADRYIWARGRSVWAVGPDPRPRCAGGIVGNGRERRSGCCRVARGSPLTGSPGSTWTAGSWSSPNQPRRRSSRLRAQLWGATPPPPTDRASDDDHRPRPRPRPLRPGGGVMSLIDPDLARVLHDDRYRRLVAEAEVQRLGRHFEGERRRRCARRFGRVGRRSLLRSIKGTCDAKVARLADSWLAPGNRERGDARQCG